MNIFICILIFIIIFFLTSLIYIYKNINIIYKYIDDILNGNLNQRIRLQTNIKCLSKLTIKINALIGRLQYIEKKSIISEESRKKMISNISHDLRTPLTSILGYLELIVNDPNLSKSEINNYIKIVYTKGNYLYDMLEEFFEISKLDSKDFKLDIKSINICEIIRQQLIYFFNEFKRKGIEPKLNFKKDNIYVNADEKALNRILNNIISNILKHGKNSTKICVDINYKDKKSCFILEEKLNIKDYTLWGKNNLRVYERLQEVSTINKVLVSNDILVEEICLKIDSLEDYFLKLTGGN